MNKKALIVKNGYYTSRSYEYQIARFTEELARYNVETVLYENNKPFFASDYQNFDFVMFLDKDVNLAIMMEQAGMKVFNSSNAVENADNKARSAALLGGDTRIRQQVTVIRPKRYFYDGADENFLRETAKKLGFPLVAKFACGSLGEQVFLVHTEDELKQIDEKMNLNDGIYQAFRRGSVGESYRVIVIGEKVLGACKLKSKDDFRSNAHGGGKGEFVTLPEEFEKTAISAAKKLGLDYCGVDLFCDEPVVIEVNGNAFFDEFEKQTGINVAKAYVEYIMSKVYD